MLKTYNSVLKDVLIDDATDILYYGRNQNDDNKKIYEKFDEDFQLYLNKLPNNNVKKYVSEVFNRKLITFGQNQLSKSGGLSFVKILSDDNKSVLSGINLDNKEFEINLKTGESKNIDDCIYAVYFALVRFAVITNRTTIRNDTKLQQMLAQYLYQIFISVIDTSKIDTPKQKFYIKLVSYYVFYRYFIRETLSQTVKILRNSFKDNKDLIDEFSPMFKDIEKYTSVKDFAKILIDCNIAQVDPNMFSINLFKKYKQYGFYCIYSSLDKFAAFSVITKYPFDMFEDVPTVNSSLQEDIENIIVGYMRKIPYGTRPLTEPSISVSVSATTSTSVSTSDKER